MNIIQNQAGDFYETNYRQGRTKHQSFLAEVKSELYNYRRDSHKIEFLNTIIDHLKKDFDNHYFECTSPIKEDCPINTFFQNALFFLQIELEDLSLSLTDADFSPTDKLSMTLKLDNIIDEVRLLKLGQELTYDDFFLEFQELKDLYFLNKKTWSQLLTGKLVEMLASGIITETLCKSLITIISNEI